MKKSVPPLLGIALAFAPLHHALAISNYQLTILDTPYLGTFFAADINDHGQVVGTVESLTSYSAIVWEAGTSKKLGTGRAYSINNLGYVVGYDGRHGRMWDTATNSSQLLFTEGYASSINDNNVVTGWRNPLSGAENVLWQNGKVSKVSVSDGFGRIGDINIQGDFIGSSFSDALVWKSGQQAVLPRFENGYYTSASGINDHGDIVGSTQLTYESTGPYKALIWQNGQVSELETLTGKAGSRASDINNNGLVVGSSFSIAYTSSGQPFNLTDYKAVIWENGKAYDLSSLILNMKGLSSIEYAYGINNQGQIIGQGRLRDGVIRSYLLTPVSEVPLPAGGLLFTSSLLGLGLLRRKKAV